MNSEKEIIISFIFKRSGKEALDFSDIYLALSMDLNWFTPDDAKSFVTLALKDNLLIKKDNLIKPNFDYKKTSIPLGFSPSERVFEEKQIEERETTLEKMIKVLVKKTKEDRSQILKKIEILANQRNISKEVAGLLIGKENNTSFNDFYDEIEEKIFSK
jgi:hypothetical protein